MFSIVLTSPHSNVAGSIFDKPWVRDLCNQISNELKSQIDWIEVRTSSSADDSRDTKMLDYACGNGVVSRVGRRSEVNNQIPYEADHSKRQALAPFVSQVRGMDISPGMINQYNKLARAEGFTENQMSGVPGNLLDDTDDNAGEEYHDFDLIVMSMALHHVQNPDEMIKRLSERLCKGGVLLIVDWVSNSESGLEELKPPADSPVRHTVSRHGFEEKEVKEAYEKAGMTSWGWRWFSSRSKLPTELGGGEQQLFMARGTK